MTEESWNELKPGESVVIGCTGRPGDPGVRFCVILSSRKGGTKNKTAKTHRMIGVAVSEHEANEPIAYSLLDKPIPASSKPGLLRLRDAIDKVLERVAE